MHEGTLRNAHFLHFVTENRKPFVKQIALRYGVRMADKRIINARVTVAEADILAAYAEAVGQTQTDVLRGFIRSLESRLRRLTKQREDQPSDL
jgi:hypothetical protein